MYVESMTPQWLFYILKSVVYYIIFTLLLKSFYNPGRDLKRQKSLHKKEAVPL